MPNSEGLIEQALAGNQRALSRLATELENDSDRIEEITARLYLRAGRAHILGVTGAPGVGKSSLLSGLAREVSRRGRRIAIVAIDPSSLRTGGATLGDRIRMTGTALDPNIFVRSLASRDRHDGLAPAAANLALLFDAAGYDYVAIETVGSGQDQLEIADLVHTTVLVQIPGTGDSVQLLKAGAMEIADIYAVNKADLPGAQRVSRDLRATLSLAPHEPGSWDPPIVLVSSTEETGFAKLLAAIMAHLAYLSDHELLAERQMRMARSELRRAVDRRLRLEASTKSRAVDELVLALAEHEISPEVGARSFLELVTQDDEQR